MGIWALIRSWIAILWRPIWTALFRLILDDERVQLRKDASAATTYEAWRTAQEGLDALNSVGEWASSSDSRVFNALALRNFKDEMAATREAGDSKGVAARLRSIYSRNPSNILNPTLYVRSHICTKDLIRDYGLEVHACIDHLCRAGGRGGSGKGVSLATRRQLFFDVRGSIGTTTLVLMGGAMLSMCHLGVVRALHLRGLLPKIITASGTGALVAAITASTPDTELLHKLSGESIDLGAFVRAQQKRKDLDAKMLGLSSWWQAVHRRIRRFISTGHFFDIHVLTDCVRDNLGNLTFDEAYAISGRSLNITIAVPDAVGTPQLLNHYTAPHVLVWSAVVASVATSRRLYAPVQLYCKNNIGAIEPYIAADASHRQSRRSRSARKEAPLQRIGELFNTNHYIVSQTRPYIVPFKRLQMWADRYWMLGNIVRVVFCEAIHWLEALDSLGFTPTFLSCIIIDEVVPSSASWSKLVITPELAWRDYLQVINLPTPRKINDLALRGERGVWPMLCNIQIRQGVELDFEAACEQESKRYPSIGGPISHR